MKTIRIQSWGSLAALVGLVAFILAMCLFAGGCNGVFERPPVQTTLEQQYDQYQIALTAAVNTLLRQAGLLDDDAYRACDPIVRQAYLVRERLRVAAKTNDEASWGVYVDRATDIIREIKDLASRRIGAADGAAASGG